MGSQCDDGLRMFTDHGVVMRATAVTPCAVMKGVIKLIELEVRGAFEVIMIDKWATVLFIRLIQSSVLPVEVSCYYRL